MGQQTLAIGVGEVERPGVGVQVSDLGVVEVLGAAGAELDDVLGPQRGELRAVQRPRIDLPGALAVTLGLAAIVYGATTAGQDGWTSPIVWISIAAAGAFLTVFRAIERRVDQPLIGLPVLAKRHIAFGNLAGLLAFATETSLVFVLTFYLQDVLGLSPLLAGLSFGVLGVGTVLGGLLGPRLIGRTDAKRAIILGFLVHAAATIPLAFAGAERAWIVPLLALTFLGGIANLVAIVGYVVASTSGLPDEQQGLATALVTMSEQVGITLGTPIMSAIMSGVVAGRTGPAGSGLLSAVQTAIWVNGLLCVAAAVIVAAALRLPHQTASPAPAAAT